MIFQSIFRNRFRILLLFLLPFFGASFVTRSALLLKSWTSLRPDLWLVVKIYGTGFFFDAVTASYVALALVVYLMLAPDRLFQSWIHKILANVFFWVSIDLLLFIAVAEYYFFAEFGTRFNFVTIDYLVYTRELIRNLVESFPLLSYLLGIALVALFILLGLRKHMDHLLAVKSTVRQRMRDGLLFLLFPAVALWLVDSSLTRVSSNVYANEVAANGLYNLGAAFMNNHIDFDTFYLTRDYETVFRSLKTSLNAPHGTFVSDDLLDITREMRNRGQEKRWNVVVIVMESLSAEYLETFGNRRHLTPYLDRLVTNSLFFTHLYATGTRTDRGLESITLSIPPTPGRSIVKRPDNEALFSWGTLMRERGYDTKFIYGGYGYFDNMNFFFSHNGFEVIDRRGFNRDEITFENVWGVCDEDLYRRSMKEFERSFEKGTPFFALILNTSNHRPFTYPQGKIDIPSHTGRNGGVKYADYALGQFLTEARTRPWFGDTLFVIVADHCANSAGKTRLPVKRYEIPLLIYAPAHLSPEKIDKVASQIDIAPTVLGLLGFSYESRFFGQDILAMAPDQERAFIGTYQRLGLLKKNRLCILDLKKEGTVYQVDLTTGEADEIPLDTKMLDEAISYYEGADYLFQHHLNRWKPFSLAASPVPREVN
jgi:phosphoglycerol transferase MdoB-like AlkP superfamily enzyme